MSKLHTFSHLVCLRSRRYKLFIIYSGLAAHCVSHDPFLRYASMGMHLQQTSQHYIYYATLGYHSPPVCGLQHCHSTATGGFTAPTTAAPFVKRRPVWLVRPRARQASTYALASTWVISPFVNTDCQVLLSTSVQAASTAPCASIFSRYQWPRSGLADKTVACGLRGSWWTRGGA
jgi:hypothetical protein